MHPFLAALAGGALIGASAALLLLVNGRIAGISGIAGGLLGRWRAEDTWRAAFLVGLLAGPLAYRQLTGGFPEIALDASWPLVLAAGLLVGIGTSAGSGCTSGHGVCGLARLSPRSAVAVATFMATAILTVFLLRHSGLR